MSELALHLAYLLQRHDCVALPGFGAFLAVAESAVYDAVRGVFTPPSRTLVFNPALAHNDGLIVESVARREGISFARARRQVEAQVAQLKGAISSCGGVELPGVGRFERGASPEATPTFIPDAAAVSRRMAWLPEVTIRRLVAVEPSAEGVAAEPRAAMPGLSFMWRVAAAAAIVLGLGFYATIPGSGRMDNVDYASVGVSPSRHAVEEAAPASSAEEPALAIALPSGEDAPVATADDGDVYLVVASLPSRAGAERFIASTGDATLRILHSDGRYRVYSGRYATRLEALHARALSSYADAWVLGE